MKRKGKLGFKGPQDKPRDKKKGNLTLWKTGK